MTLEIKNTLNLTSFDVKEWIYFVPVPATASPDNCGGPPGTFFSVRQISKVKSNDQTLFQITATVL